MAIPLSNRSDSRSANTATSPASPAPGTIDPTMTTAGFGGGAARSSQLHPNANLRRRPPQVLLAAFPHLPDQTVPNPLSPDAHRTGPTNQSPWRYRYPPNLRHDNSLRIRSTAAPPGRCSVRFHPNVRIQVQVGAPRHMHQRIAETHLPSRGFRYLFPKYCSPTSTSSSFPVNR